MQNKPFSSLSLFFLFFFAFGFTTHGQNLFGKVTSGKTSIEYCNVILRQASDSLFISGTVTDSVGMFSFNKVKEGKYFVEYLVWDMPRNGCRSAFLPKMTPN